MTQDVGGGVRPVVVVGAGPTGLLAANLLAGQGVPVLVLEKNAGTVEQPRAIVLDDEGMRALQAAGLHRQMLSQAVPGLGARFLDEAGDEFARTGEGVESYGFRKRYFIDQPDLERVLAEGLAQRPQAELRFGACVDQVLPEEDFVALQVTHGGVQTTLRAQWVLACDGARSPIRDHLGIRMEGFAYPDRWLVIDTLNDPDQDAASKVHCRLDRPYLSIPAPNGGRRYEFRLAKAEDAEAVTALGHVRALLEPIREIHERDLRRTAVYGFRAALAEQFGVGRVLLMGDAAHLTPPFAGQGMNAGLRDAFNVAWKVALAVRGVAPAALLDSYQAERREPAAAMIQLAVTMGEIIMPETETDKALRLALLAKLAPYPGVRDYLVNMRFKPPPRYDAAGFVGLAEPSVPGSLVGTMIPQPQVTQGGAPLPLDEALGGGFAVIVQSRDLALWAAERRDRLWPQLQPRLILLEREEGAPIDGVAVLGGLGEPIAFPLLAHRDQLLLVRPDRYAAAAVFPAGAQSAVDRFMARVRGG